MGCGPSKHAASAVVGEKESPLALNDADQSTGHSTAATKKAGSEESLRSTHENKGGGGEGEGGQSISAAVAVVRPPNPLASSKHTDPLHHNDWKVRPGYSSGASSCADSDGEGDHSSSCFDNNSTHRHHHHNPSNNSSASTILHSRTESRSNILDLETLKEEMKEKGDIASALVRIETPFGKPIEEIYADVHDGPVLGSGVSGIVRLVTHRRTGVKYAVKCLDIGLIDTMEGLRQLRNEIFIMCQLDHPNIVRIEEVYESTNEIYIVQELCVGGDLFDRLDEQPDFHYTEAQCARLVKQMVSAVRYLHSKGIIHRDLKLENFLFTNQNPDSELKMIDFGLSKHFEWGESLHDKVGTPYTVAPEILKGAYDEKCDIWAVGVITYLLLSGETPFGGLDGENMMIVKENIMRARVMFAPADVWDHVSKEGKSFVKRLLQADPKKRPTAKQAQKDAWIQVWAKKDIKEGQLLNAKTLESLVAFKESSDMQKILSEVLSFTLLPDQIADLRKEFELIDTDGDGEITLGALRRVLVENAEAGMLGALTEQEIEDIFDAMKIRKNEPTIRWHEFLAAGLSQARVDDRNLRLAFDRLDSNRRGFISFDDLQDLLGNSTEYEELEKIWRDSLTQCKCSVDRISFVDFKKLMKGQPKESNSERSFRRTGNSAAIGIPNGLESALERSFRRALNPVERDKSLSSLPEENLLSDDSLCGRSVLKEPESDDEEDESMPKHHVKKKSRSHEFKSGVVWDDLDRTSTLAFVSSKGDEDDKVSPLMNNRYLYRKHRGMRLAVLEASKQFDKKRSERQESTSNLAQAGLIMKRGARTPVELEDAHTRALFDVAAKRCGRSRNTRKKTVSDMTGMLAGLKP